MLQQSVMPGARQETWSLATCTQLVFAHNYRRNWIQLVFAHNYMHSVGVLHTTTVETGLAHARAHGVNSRALCAYIRECAYNTVIFEPHPEPDVSVRKDDSLAS